jgi:hypothetical protein
VRTSSSNIIALVLASFTLRFGHDLFHPLPFCTPFIIGMHTLLGATRLTEPSESLPRLITPRSLSPVIIDYSNAPSGTASAIRALTANTIAGMAHPRPSPHAVDFFHTIPSARAKSAACNAVSAARRRFGLEVGLGS